MAFILALVGLVSLAAGIWRKEEAEEGGGGAVISCWLNELVHYWNVFLFTQQLQMFEHLVWKQLVLLGLNRCQVLARLFACVSDAKLVCHYCYINVTYKKLWKLNPVSYQPEPEFEKDNPVPVLDNLIIWFLIWFWSYPSSYSDFVCEPLSRWQPIFMHIG